MKLRTFVPALLTSAALVTAPVVAGAAPASAATASRQATASQARAIDVAWMKASAQSDLFEIASGRIAVQKATTNGVAELGEMFAEMHALHLRQLRALAKAEGVTLPTALTPKQAAVVEKLESTPEGIAWDRTWARAQAAGHRMSVIMTGKARQTSRDPEILAFERATLKVVQAHQVEVLLVLAVIANPKAV